MCDEKLSQHLNVALTLYTCTVVRQTHTNALTSATCC